MDEKDLRTLHILESIEREKPPSQRDLAREMNISLGLVNSFIKRLAKKGYFKITHIPKNRIRYILTPEGAAEKTRLTYAYIQHSYKLYSKSHQKLRQIFSNLAAQGVRRVVLYGATEVAEIACLLLPYNRIKLVGIVDDHKSGTKIAGTRVFSSARLNDFHYDKILITSFDPRPKVMRSLKRAGVSEKRIAML